MPYKDIGKRRKCQAQSTRKWKQLHRLENRERKRRMYDEHMKFIRAMKERPCIDCGVEYPHFIMEFDHMPGTKEHNVSGMGWRGMSRIINEIDKCDVVCANCHRKREWERRTK